MTVAPPVSSPPPAAMTSNAAVTSAAAAGPAQPTAGGDLRNMERAMIEQALQSARFNRSKAAKTLGLTRHQLYLRMRKYDLR